MGAAEASHEPERAVVLVRVSSEDQKVKGWSHADQLELLPRLAREAGYVIAERPGGKGPAIYDEGAASTTPLPEDILGLDTRPVLRELVDELPLTKPAWVVCRTGDRLHRNRLQSEFMMSQLVRNGCRGYAMFPSMQGAPVLRNLQEPREQAWAAVEAVFSELDKIRIREQMAASRRRRMQEGLPNGGRAPYGYRRVPLQPRAPLVVHDEEAGVYLQMVEWATQGHGPAYIAKQLNDAGVLTRSGTPTWSSTTVRRILASRAPMGEMRAGVGRGKGKPQERWLPSTHEPIISEKDWLAMRAVRSRAAVPATSDNRKRHALAGVLRCPTCGKTLKAHVNRPRRPSGGRYEYWHYTCRVYESGCSRQTSISEKRAIAELAEALTERLDAQSRNGWLSASVETDVTRLAQQVEELTERYGRAMQKLRRAQTNYEETPDRLLAQAAARVRQNEERVIAIQDELDQQRARLVAARSAAERPSIDVEQLVAVLRDWENFTDDDRKRKVIEVVVDRAIVHPPRRGHRRLEIVWREPY